MRIILIVALMLFCFSAQAKDYSSWLNNCESHRGTVESMLKSAGLNRDYYFLMVAESRCRVGAESPKGAQGFWQLMPRTGKHFGCDNLGDVECSTVAAIRYIKHLQETFSTFRDVIIAWNMGGHNYRKQGASREAIGLYTRVMEIKKNDSE